MLSLGEDIAAELLKGFSKREVLKITQYMSSLKKIETDEVDSILEEFTNVLSAEKGHLKGDKDFTKRVIEKTFSKKDKIASLFIKHRRHF